MTSKDLVQLGVVDDVIREPLGGAHRDHHLMANRLKIYLRNCLRELVDQPVDQLLEARYQKFRRMGVFWKVRWPSIFSLTPATATPTATAMPRRDRIFAPGPRWRSRSRRADDRPLSLRERVRVRAGGAFV